MRRGCHTIASSVVKEGIALHRARVLILSISTLQEKFFNKGCGTVVIGAAAIAMVASMFSRFGGSSSRGQNGDNEASAVVTVGSVPIPAALIQEQTSQMQSRAMQQQAQAAPGLPNAVPPLGATTQAAIAASATNQVLQTAAIRAILAKDPPTDAEIRAFASAEFEQAIAGEREALQKQGKLLPNATEADLEKALKGPLQGKTIAQARAAAPDNLSKQFKDPATRDALLDSIGGPLLVQRNGTKAVGSDQALRDSFKTYVVHRIFLSATSGAKDTPEVRGEKVLADLKSGRTFAAEMDAVSNDPTLPGKKAHDLTETLPASAFDSRPELAELKGKAAGAMTGVVDTAGGKAIYQIISVSDGIPKDFEKKKAELRQQKISTVGAELTEKQIKALLDSGEVKWQSLGYQALAKTGQAVQMMGMTPIIFDAAADKAAIDAGEAALKSDNPLDHRLGAQALLVATDPKIAVVKSGDSSATRKVALEAASDFDLLDPTLGLELASLYGDSKDGVKATAALIAASKANHQYDAEGERTFRDIAAKSLELQKKGVLTKEQLESVQAQQAAWTSARENNAKASTQAKTDAASISAANAAEIERQKAEAAKSAPAPSGSSPAPAKGGTDAANAAEIARQKAESNKPAASAGTTPGKSK